ncbi:MAG TPA: hypothetical protein PKY76_01960 [Bacteroidales bacterium]|nr:hypothetical protein [Bacteroidales bacterium]HPO64698.1 hypothetical protein [Bacteroidales bacterium]
MRTQFTKKEHQDAGLALLLLIILLRIFHVVTVPDPVLVAVILLIILIPSVWYPFSFLWYNLSDALGRIVSMVFLNIVYWLLVVPVALIRRMLGKDSLQLQKFKKNSPSAFIERNYTFTSKDLTNTF